MIPRKALRNAKAFRRAFYHHLCNEKNADLMYNKLMRIKKEAFCEDNKSNRVGLWMHAPVCVSAFAAVSFLYTVVGVHAIHFS